MKCTNCGSKKIKVKKDTYTCKKCKTTLDWHIDEETGDLVDSAGTIIEKKKTPFQEVLEFCRPIIIAVIIALLLKAVVFANAQVPTGSMLNTIQKGDRVIASKISYVFDDPERYDIIIFKYPDDESQYYVKRIIGLPGETVNIVSGIVYVTDADGKTTKLDDSFVTACTPVGDFGPYTVPENSYFVLGDNRNDSLDSRYWQTTNYVSRKEILGKVLFRYLPTVGKIE